MTASDENEARPQIRPKPPHDGPQSRAAAPVFDVRDLLGGGREAILVHAGDRYRLRVTANQKLILTK